MTLLSKQTKKDNDNPLNRHENQHINICDKDKWVPHNVCGKTIRNYCNLHLNKIVVEVQYNCIRIDKCTLIIDSHYYLQFRLAASTNCPEENDLLTLGCLI